MKEWNLGVIFYFFVDQLPDQELGIGERYKMKWIRFFRFRRIKSNIRL